MLTINILGCAACGGDHRGVRVYQLGIARVVESGATCTWWCVCPKTGTTVYVSDGDEPESAT